MGTHVPFVTPFWQFFFFFFILFFLFFIIIFFFFVRVTSRLLLFVTQ